MGNYFPIMIITLMTDAMKCQSISCRLHTAGEPHSHSLTREPQILNADFGLLGSNTLLTFRFLQTFQRYIPPPSVGYMFQILNAGVGLLGSNALLTFRFLQTFQTYIPPPSVGHINYFPRVISFLKHYKYYGLLIYASVSMVLRLCSYVLVPKT
jgi:hypothetical protein